MPEPKPKPVNEKQEEFNSMMDAYVESRKDSLGSMLKELFAPPKGKTFFEWMNS